MSDILEYFECTHCGAKFPNEPIALRHICPKKAESQTTAVQQLKAEIAALESKLRMVGCVSVEDTELLCSIREEMRQLSAVYGTVV